MSRKHSVSKMLLAAVSAVLLVPPAAVAGPATSASAPTGVRTTARSEVAPAAARGVLAWSQNSRRRPNQYDLYLKQGRRDPFRVNRRRTWGTAGDINGSTLAYTQGRNTGRSDIRFLNLDTGRRRAPGAVNTRRNFETQPSRAGSWLLFVRSRRTSGSPQRVILRNLATGGQRLLAVGDGGRRWAQAGKLRGRFATYVKCHSLSFCNVFRYNIASRRTVRVPNPRHKALYAASVTGNGTVYYAMGSRANCPRDAALWKFTRSGRRVRLAALGPRFDIAVTSPVVLPNGTVEVYFDAFRVRRDCASRSADIYKVEVR